MQPTSNVTRLFTERGGSYGRFVRFVRYPQGFLAYFMSSPHLRPGVRVLDAGCGSGVVTLALRKALLARGFTPGRLHGFDLTPAMLDLFRASLRAEAIEGVELVQCDVLELNTLPGMWKNYDLIVTASMLEYVPRDRLADALSGLRALMHEEGRLLLFITRKNWLMKLLVGRWWRSNVYTAAELREAFTRSGFSTFGFRKFPRSVGYMNLWGLIVEARK